MGNKDVNYWDTNNYAPAGLDLNTTYYWRIDEVASNTKGNVWSFTTVFPAPGQANNPTPDDGATNVGAANDLIWTAGSYATSHDVYFGTVNPPPFVANQTGTTYDTGIMEVNTTYYWRIDEKNTGGTTTGSIWNFITSLLPVQASNPTPSNGATEVGIEIDLGWTAGSYATSHDVYFGTVNPPPFVANQTGTTYDTGIMEVNTTYYWRIDEKNASGTTEGDIWSFTTIVFLLWADGFESGNFTAGGWMVYGSYPVPSVSPNAKYTGTYGARIPSSISTRYIVKSKSTEGYSTIHLNYDRKLSSSIEFQMTLAVQWSSDGGSSWTTLETASGSGATTWVSKDYALSTAADNNPNLQVRFISTSGASIYYADIDNVGITAQSNQ